MKIGTHTGLKVKSAVRKVAAQRDYALPNDAGEYTQYSDAKIQGLLKDIDVPATLAGTDELVAMVEEDDEFEAFYERHRSWFADEVTPMLGEIITRGVHPCGLLILDEPYDHQTPIREHRDAGDLTMWAEEDLESVRFVKFDFLVIDAVSIISYTRKLIDDVGGSVPASESIPLDDPKAMEVFRSGETRGIFQMRSWAQRTFARKLRPDTFEHVVAAQALIRPGPMALGAHTTYAETKNGEREPEDVHEAIEDILEPTYGLMVYQEQIMQIVQRVGGLSAAEADHVRKAVGKKDLDKMKRWRKRFVDGAVEQGYGRDFVDGLWADIEGFAEYAFNKAHSTSYAKVAYEQAYLRAHYPEAYWPAAMEYAGDDSGEASSAQRMKFKVRQAGVRIEWPTVYGFAPKFEPVGASGDAMHWPLTRISGIGRRVADELCRAGRRSFTSMKHMLETVDPQVINKGVVDKMIVAGFFDPLGLPPWEIARRYYDLRVSVLGQRHQAVPYELDHQNKFKWYQARNDAYGCIVFPWKKVAPFHDNVETYRGERLVDDTECGDLVFVGGYVEQCSHRVDRNGGHYAKLTLVDEGERLNVMVRSGKFESKRLDTPDEYGIVHRPWLGQLVELTGTRDEWNGWVHINCTEGCYLRVIWDEFQDHTAEAS